MPQQERKKTEHKEKPTLSYRVYDGRELILPTLTDREVSIAISSNAEEYIKNGVHSESAIGWTDMVDFRESGVLLQSLDALTAKVLLVIDHPNALFLLAMYNRTYSHFGLRLIIDETTVFRSPFTDSDSSGGSGTPEGSGNQSKSDVEKFDTLDTFGMEVA